ncbi:hypothetical protein RvY_19537 [Ramazzottius varieornatus]|uniref:Uncharacterized protein n=1 Tax=Ramazzottius varieornatus TaxID=947166 RepID=A0A1D1WCB3_RAMVA|nr:hypothetical protein RvY_11190 [Ramazzottius varieornatus]GAV10039.1 hypothetical protein RvY_19537 [Ramazzottius varieornatus]
MQEREKVVSLQKSRAPNKVIVREMQKLTGKAIIPKNFANVRRKIDIEERDGRDEQGVLDRVLA